MEQTVKFIKNKGIEVHHYRQTGWIYLVGPQVMEAVAAGTTLAQLFERRFPGQQMESPRFVHGRIGKKTGHPLAGKSGMHIGYKAFQQDMPMAKKFVDEFLEKLNAEGVKVETHEF